ncbi:MAG: hypothetical protein HC922_09840 [Leptolyngbyaceae cyanobacterium SM2_3_12]|nr:hypothetical protein [Leptolyngbyaceae cyanobacterium SM2_3_12]
MASDYPPADLILTAANQALGQVSLDSPAPPGTVLEFEGKAYTVLEQRHRYRLRAGSYHLHQIILSVSFAPRLDEVTQMGDRTIIGDISCAYNARSELIRCAPNPTGPCQGCQDYRAR